MTCVTHIVANVLPHPHPRSQAPPSGTCSVRRDFQKVPRLPRFLLDVQERAGSELPHSNLRSPLGLEFQSGTHRDTSSGEGERGAPGAAAWTGTADRNLGGRPCHPRSALNDGTSLLSLGQNRSAVVTLVGHSGGQSRLAGLLTRVDSVDHYSSPVASHTVPPFTAQETRPGQDPSLLRLTGILAMRGHPKPFVALRGCDSWDPGNPL